jgi:hypothetical protein
MSEEATPALDWPDSMTPVYGFRAWTYANTGRGIDFPLVLRNIGGARQTWWDSTGWTYASCQGPKNGPWAGQPSCPGPVPHIDCECGLYAYHHSIRLKSSLRSLVVGAVKGQGMSDYGVIRHGREGWRAEMAKPIAFVRPTMNGTQGYLANDMPGMIERLAGRLGARLFDTIDEMDYWVRYESGLECFWTAEDEAQYLAEYRERMRRDGRPDKNTRH